MRRSVTPIFHEAPYRSFGNRTEYYQNRHERLDPTALLFAECLAGGLPARRDAVVRT
jgi:hypothetical protein